MDLSRIRNFCIIAHIDHGKSTLADRLIEFTGTLQKRDMKHAQVLDQMDLEQERGITIKLTPVRMEYEYDGDDPKFLNPDGSKKKYILNLIDTPGHVDFSYEVSRSLAAVEGAILIVDATQGIEAQTLSHTYTALHHDLELVPVLNKIDLPMAEVEKRSQEIEDSIGLPKEDVIPVSAKHGTNVEKVLRAIVEKCPSPKVDLKGVAISDDEELKALIFDSIYDSYRGVVVYVRVINGSVKKGDKVFFLSAHKQVEVLEVGYFKPKYHATGSLFPGEIGYIVTDLKEIEHARVGDTVWKQKAGTSVEIEIAKAVPLPGYQVVKPYVFASIFCSDNTEYNFLRDALEKLKLNDAALSFEPEHSAALGSGFRCGFLGLLHLDIIQERLEREYDLDLVVTAPSTSYIVVQNGGNELFLSAPSAYPDPATIAYVKEPVVSLEILTPKEYVGGVIELCTAKRGVNTDMQYLSENRVILKFDMPFPSIVTDFYDKLKSISSGYASMNYEFVGYRESDLVKLDMLINGKSIDAFSSIVHRSEAAYIGRDVALKLKSLIPRSNFEIVIQAAIGGKIIAKERISPYRKDVIAKLYGGDRTRKDKLLNKQKKGKKRMKMVGNVNIPQEAFLAVLKKDNSK